MAMMASTIAMIEETPAQQGPAIAKMKARRPQGIGLGQGRLNRRLGPQRGSHRFRVLRNCFSVVQIEKTLSSFTILSS